MERLGYKDYALRVMNKVSKLPGGKNVSREAVMDILDKALDMLEQHNNLLPRTFTKVLYVEDGSVDVDELEQSLKDTKVIVYRQGAVKPDMIDVSNNPIEGY